MINKIITVGVWGWYDRGNYGDDLMAVMVAKYLKSRGFQPIVFGLLSSVAQREGLESQLDLERFVREIDACIVGGGGLFLSHPGLDEEVGTFMDAVENKGLPLCVVSVGGDDVKVSASSQWEGRARLGSYRHLRGFTCRTPSLPACVNCDNATHVPDLVLSVCSMLPCKRQVEESFVPRVGVNLPSWKGWGWAWQTIRMMTCLRLIRPVFLKTTHECGPLDYEHMPTMRMFDEVISYQNPTQFLEDISTLNLLVSFKLHAGVSALSFGTPFVSVGGQAKTRLFMESVGLKECVVKCRKREALKLFAAVLRLRNKSALHVWPQLRTAIADAEEHFRVIDRFLDTLRAGVAGRTG